MQERIQKLISNAGIAARRVAEEMMKRGQVTVNGQVVTELGTKADPEHDHIKVKGKLINPLLVAREKAYILINKPRGYLSAVSDPKKRPLVMEIIPAQSRRGLHPVGRLDFNSEGLIILTNDGELTHQLTKGGVVAKVYNVKVKGTPGEDQIERLRRGIPIRGRHTSPCEIKMIERTKEAGNCWYEVTLREGRNQQIRRMFDAIGHSVIKLKRVRIGHITDKGLELGQHRELTPAEVKKFFQPAPATKSSRPKKSAQKRFKTDTRKRSK